MIEKEEPIYVGMENPAEVRRALLESSKMLIHILQANEKLKAGKAEKKRLAIKLTETLRQATHLLGQLKSLMPKVKMASLPKKEKQEPKIPKMMPQQKMQEPKASPKTKMTEAEKLDSELKEIEEKLSKL